MIHTVHVQDRASVFPLTQWDVAVVIDVIRAFTTAPWVLRQGASSLYLARNAHSAVAERDARFPEALLLKDGVPDQRFPLHNAPGDVAQADLSGRVVIQTTGNGARAAHEMSEVATVLCASFANASATARALSAFDKVLLVPTEGDEDVALADFIASVLTTGTLPPVGEYVERVRCSTAGRECAERGPNPAYPGFHPDDLRRCMDVDAFDEALTIHRDGNLLAVRPFHHSPSAKLG